MRPLRYKINIPTNELSFTCIRARGAGGQHVNKVASAIHLRFNIKESSLPDAIKQRLLAVNDNRINKEGIIVIKAQQFRSLEKNKINAIDRLHELVNQSAIPQKSRKATRPSYNSIKKRLTKKTNRSRVKKLRSKVLG